MANLLFTDFCNRTCPYCFAKEKLGPSETANNTLAFENLVKVLDFLDASGEKFLNVLGGEPTLHPEFGFFLRYILSRSFSPTIFTNGMISDTTLGEIGEVISDFSPLGDSLRFVVNINERYLRSRAEEEMQKRTFAQAGMPIVLGFNIFRSDHELSFLLETIERHGLLREIRMSLAQPIIGKANEFLQLADYPLLRGQLLEFARACDKTGVKIIMDCGFPLCLFKDEDIGRLYRYGVFLSFHCGPSIDIGPDLKAWFCFPLAEAENVLLGDFDNLHELADHFGEVYREPLRHRGIYKECSTCRYLERGQCLGGCMGHYLSKGIPEVTSSP